LLKKASSNGGPYVSQGIAVRRYEKDSTVEGKTYKLFRTHSYFYDTGTFPSDQLKTRIALELVRQSGDTIFVRHGSPSLPLAILAKENVYFILSMVEGDVLKFGDKGSLTIDSVSTKKINDFTLKSWWGTSYAKFVFDRYAYEYFPLNFIERLGPVNDYWYYFAFGGGEHAGSNEPYVKLRCYYDPEIGKVN
jgi:hypothetical protein